MKMSAWRKLLWLVSIPAAPVAAALLLPWLLDGEHLKPTVVAAATKATGRQVVIDGPLTYSLLPRPSIVARGIRIARNPGERGAPTAEVGQMDVALSWRGLLEGRVIVESLSLHKPRIAIETLEDGQLVWAFSEMTDDHHDDERPAIARIEIVQGAVVHSDRESGRTIEAEGVDLAAWIGLASRTFHAAGTATVEGVPVALDVEVGSRELSGRSLKFGAKLPGGRLDFDGRTSALSSADIMLTGRLALESANPAEFVDALVRLSGHEPVPLSERVARRLGFEGDIEVSRQRIAVDRFKLSIADQTASGALTLTRGPAPALAGHLEFSRIDADHWLKVAQDKAFLAAAPGSRLFVRDDGKQRPRILSELPEGASVKVALQVAEIRYRNQSIRDVSTRLDIREGMIRFPEMKAVLPGDMTVHTTTAPGWEDPGAARAGHIELAGNQLRVTLKWLGIDTDGIPASRLQTLRAEGRIELTTTQVLTSDVKFSLDGAEGRGSGAVVFAIPVILTSTVHLPSFDLDGYVPQPDARPAAAEVVLGRAGRNVAPGGSATETSPPVPPPKFAIKAKVDNLVYRGQSALGVDVDFVAQGRRLDLNGLSVRDMLGAKLEAKGTVADYGITPRFDLSYTAQMSDADSIYEHFGLPTFINGRIGAAFSSGKISGNLSDIAVRDLAVSMLDATFRATGTVRLGEKFAFDFARFSMQTQDVSRLLAAATGSSFPEIGPVSATGIFRGDTEKASFQGALNLLDTQMAGKVSTTLDAHPSVLAEFRVSGTLPLNRLIPGPEVAAASSASRAASRSASLDPGLGYLRSFDGSLTVSADAVTFGAARVAVTELSVSLRRGILKLANLGGTFHGGTFELSGGIDASGAQSTVFLAGHLLDIDIRNALDLLRGGNTFGNDQLTIAADGSLNIAAIEVSGSGLSVEDIARSLVARGRIGGSLRAMVTRGSRSFASFGAGIASIFSTEMGLGSAILDAFIDQTSRLDGEVNFADGVLSLRDQNILGRGAKAVINGRTDLRQLTTDTTVTFEIGTPGPTDYSLTAKGPLVAPTVQVYGR
jgi:AsmA family